MGNWKIIVFFLTGTVFFFLLLRWQGQALVTPASPAGIVSFELAFHKHNAAAITEAWKQGHGLAFFLNILLDFLMIPFYGLFFYSICGFFSEQYKTGILQRVAVLLAFGSLMAVIMDIGENLLMLFSFYISVAGPIVWMTGAVAVLKFAFIACCLAYILFSSVYLLLKKLV